MDGEAPVTEPRRARWRPRFSLASLLCFVLLASSVYGLWWRWAPWVLERTLAGHSLLVSGGNLSPDGQRIVTVGIDDAARAWDMESGRELARRKVREVPVVSPVFLSRARILGNLDGTAHIRDVETGRELAVLKGHNGPVNKAAFSPDGRWIVTASQDNTARVWDAESGRELIVLTGHTEGVHWAAFSPDGQRIVTASPDKTARIWDAETGRELAILKGHADSVQSVAFFPDGRFILTESDRTVRLWSRRRPEWWWGVAWLPEFWTGLLSALALAFSLRRDWKTLQAR